MQDVILPVGGYEGQCFIGRLGCHIFISARFILWAVMRFVAFGCSGSRLP